MSIVFADIETTTTPSPAIKAHIAATMKPPGNMSKPETISAWLEDPKNVTSAIAKSALQGVFGQIACIGVAVDEGEPFIISGDERAMLESFRDLIHYRTLGDVKMRHEIVGHNLVNFDLPFIHQRMLIHGLGPLLPFGVKPWDAGVTDTMHMFAGLGRDYTKLADILVAFGIDNPDTIDGSQVPALWAAGEHEKVFEHCLFDVSATRRVYQHMTLSQAA